MKPFEAPMLAQEPSLADMAANITAEQIQLEVKLVGAVLGDGERESCATGVALAEYFKITPDMLDSDDLSQILSAAYLGRHLPLGTVLCGAKFGLQSQGLWDHGAPAHSRGMLWSDESLAAYAQDFCGPTWIAALAPSFIEVRSRRLRAEQAYRDAHSALDVQPFPFLRGTHERLPLVVNAPARARRVG